MLILNMNYEVNQAWPKGVNQKTPVIEKLGERPGIFRAKYPVRNWIQSLILLDLLQLC